MSELKVCNDKKASLLGAFFVIMGVRKALESEKFFMKQTDKKALGQAKGLLTALQKKEYVEDFFGMSLTGSLADDGYQFKARLFGDDYLQYRAFLELFLQSPKTARLLTLALLRYEQLSDAFSFEDMNAYADTVTYLTNLGDEIESLSDEIDSYKDAVGFLYGRDGFSDMDVQHALTTKECSLGLLKTLYRKAEHNLVDDLGGEDEC